MYGTSISEKRNACVRRWLAYLFDLTLQLVFLGARFLLVGHNRLHQRQTTFTDSGNLGILILVQLLVVGLEFGDSFFKFAFGRFHLVLFFLDFGFERFKRQFHKGQQLGLLFTFAQIQIARRANGLEIFRGKFGQVVVRSSTLVIDQSGGIAPLESWVSSHTVGVAQGLTRRGAINFGHETTGIILPSFRKLFPIGRNLLAVTALYSDEGKKEATSG
jgi:hypothetical protein